MPLPHTRLCRFISNYSYFEFSQIIVGTLVGFLLIFVYLLIYASIVFFYMYCVCFLFVQDSDVFDISPDPDDPEPVTSSPVLFPNAGDHDVQCLPVYGCRPWYLCRLLLLQLETLNRRRLQ